MIGNFKLTSDADINALIDRPKRIEKYLYGEAFSVTEPARGFFKWFSKSKPHEIDDWEPECSGDELDVDKAWHGIHYMLTGKPWEGIEPWSFVVTGGVGIGDVDVGYGPARAFGSEQVSQIDEALSSLSDEEIKRRFDPDKLRENKIYPEIWDESFDDCFAYVLSYFNDLKEFVSKAAKNNNAMIVYIN